MTKFVNEQRFNNDEGEITLSLATKCFLSMVICVCLVCSITKFNSAPTDPGHGYSQFLNSFPIEKSALQADTGRS